MNRGYLSEYFTGIAVKRLSAVEADVLRSHQHEFNGVAELRRLFGEAPERIRLPARFVYLCDGESEPVVEDGFLTWYDARQRHPTRSEYRLYFPSNEVSERASANDLLVIGRRPDGSILVVIAEDGSTVSSQIRWLFGASDLADPGYAVRDGLNDDHDRVAFASRLILETIGIDAEAPTDTYLDDMLQRFDGHFPSTREFSAYARSTLPEISAYTDCDAALVAWIEREELLFRTLERHLVRDRLAAGFEGDVDGFIAYSLSVQNRRKSRVGYALENHLETLLQTHGIRYVRGAVTENTSKPDFLFPGLTEYRDARASPARLTMLAVKSTCKDRWRQVLAEADRIDRKHLLTLEPAISTSQTDEMQSRQLQLVLPRSLHGTCTTAQQSWLLDISGFIALVRRRQVASELPSGE